MKSSLVHLICLAAMVIIAAVGYRFWYDEVVTKGTAVARLEKQIVAYRSTTDQSLSARAMLNNLSEEEASVASYFVSETNIPLLINVLQARGRDQGTRVGILSVVERGTDADPILILTLTIDGTFDAVMRTLGVIEYLPYASQVLAIDLGQDEKKNWHARLELSVRAPVTVVPALRKP